MSGKPIFYHVSSLTSLFNVNYSDRGREKQVRRLQNHSTGTPNRYSWSKSNSRHHYTSWKTREKKKKKRENVGSMPKARCVSFRRKSTMICCRRRNFFFKNHRRGEEMQKKITRDKHTFESVQRLFNDSLFLLAKLVIVILSSSSFI